MVVREPQPGEPGGYLCIPQSQHAAICGQLARSWGNRAFPVPHPEPEVCLAAERHDDGMDAFDSDPELDPESGLPRSFMRMPLEIWLDCWERGPELVAAESGYAGMLVSLHGEHLLGYRDLDAESDEDRDRARRWLAGQAELRERLAERIGADSRLAACLEQETIELARRLVEVWDGMSLAICMPRLPERFERVPGEEPTRELRMREPEPIGGRRTIEVDPWPFSSNEVALAASGRRLSGGYTDREELRAALAAADPEVLSMTLVPSESG